MFRFEDVWVAKRSTRQFQRQDYTLDRLWESFVFEELENCDAALMKMTELALVGREDTESHREFHQLRTKVRLKQAVRLWMSNHRSS